MRTSFLAAGGVLLTLGLPAVAAADTGTNGNLRLRLDIGVLPAEVSTKTEPRAVAFDFDQTLNTVNGLRPTADARRITIRLPRGFRMNIGEFPQCTLSEVIDGGYSTCPKGSKVGKGTATADARPALADPIPAKVTAYAGISDLDINDRPQTPVPALIVKAAASVSGVTVDTLIVAELRRRRLTVDFPSTPGSGGGATSAYIIRDFKLTLGKRRNAAGVPLVQTPTKCKGSWHFTESWTFADGSLVTARDNVPCVRPERG
jgi:hypothetical protein